MGKMISEETLLSLSFEASYKLYKVMLNKMREEGIATEKDYKKVRFGFNINFELDDYFKNRFREKPKSGTVIIWKDEYSLEEFRTELELRENTILESLLDYYSTDKDIIGAS